MSLTLIVLTTAMQAQAFEASSNSAPAKPWSPPIEVVGDIETRSAHQRSRYADDPPDGPRPLADDGVRADTAERSGKHLIGGTSAPSPRTTA